MAVVAATLASLLAGGLSVADWRGDVRAGAERGDALGQQGVLVVSVLELASLLTDEPALRRDLSERMDLLLDQWGAISDGGPSIGLDLRPTGRVLEPWPPAHGRFADIGDDLDAFVTSIRTSFASSSPSKEQVSMWHEQAEHLVRRLAAATLVATDVDAHDDDLLLAAVLLLTGLVVPIVALTFALGRRRRVAAEALLLADVRDSERSRFERILDQSPDAMVVFDHLAEVTWCSSELRGHGAVSRIQLRDLVHPDDLDAAATVVAEAFLYRDRTGTAVCRLATPDGGWRFVELVGRNLLDDPLVHGVVLVVREVTDRELALAEQRRLAALRAFLTENATEVMIQLDAERRMSYVSPAVAPMLELQPDDLVGVPLEAVVHPDHRLRATRLLDLADATGAPVHDDLEVIGANDAVTCWVSASVRTIVGAEGDVSYHVALVDVTERKAAETALQESEALQRLILDTLEEGVILTHRHHGVIAANRAATALTGVRVDGRRGHAQLMSAVAAVLEIDGSEMQPGDSPAERVYASGAADLDRYLQMCWHDGSVTVNVVNSVPCRVDEHGDVELVLTAFSDVTRRLEAERELARLATIDSLTSLPNRRQLELHLAQVLARRDRHGTSVAVLFVDLDGFKAVNDEHGHDVGDAVLVAAAERISATLRSADLVARLGGDEFVVVVEEIDHVEHEPLVARLTQVLGAPVTIGGRTIALGGSIGVAHAWDGCSAAQLLASADAAMYERKRARKAHAPAASGG